MFCSRFSIDYKNNCSNEPNKKNVFTAMVLRGLGCSSWTSSQVTTPVVIQSEAECKAKKVGMRKTKKKKINRMSSSRNRKTSPAIVVALVPDVCCTLPGIGFASDVAPRPRFGAERTPRHTNRERSCTRRRIVNLEHVSALDMPVAFESASISADASAAMQSRHFRRRSPGGLPEIVMFQHSLLLGGSSDGNDRFGDWRLNVDSMSYEELLNLGDKIGHVGTGLRDEDILGCIKKTKYSIFASLSSPASCDKDWKCSICQEGYRIDEELGKLQYCGHYHDMDCIKQWLLQKNACPVCQTAAVAKKPS